MAKGLVAGIVNVGVAFLRGASLPEWSVAGAAGFVGFLGVGASLVFFVLALRHLGAARTGAYFSLAPFIGAVLAIVLLHERLSFQLVTAGILMGIGLWLHLAERHEHDHVHDSLEHEHAHSHDDHHAHDHEESVAASHSHSHRHDPVEHAHPHYPDLHHRHSHKHL